jgi:hypothetical protein
MLVILAILAGIGVDCARGADPVAEPAPVGTEVLRPSVGIVPPNGYSEAMAMPDCAPWDGPAVLLYLLDSTSDAVPPVNRHVRVEIWKGQAELAHHTFRWPANPAPGAAAQCSSDGSCEAAIEGRVAFGAVDPDRSVAGELDLRFASGNSVRQAFKARWQPRRIGCG